MKNIARIYIKDHLSIGSNIILSQTQSHYLAKVLRYNIDDNIKIFNGVEGEFLAKIVAINKKEIIIEIISIIFPQKIEPNISLIFAPIKNSKMGYLIEKATELGASRFFPIITAHSSNKIFNAQKAELIAIEASEQCERMTIPVINELQKLDQLLKNWDQDIKILFCAERKFNKSILEIAGELDHSKSYALLVGPEGGFSDDEYDILSKLSFTIPVSLGSRILRAETAIVSALSILGITFNK